LFSVTSLGHQGWLIATERAAILIDPVLGGNFDGLQACGAIVHPPRRLDLARFPPVTAVVISHEHPDHFDAPSFDLLERDVVVLLGRSSQAAGDVLTGMGFPVHAMRSLERITFEDLSLMPLAPDTLGKPGDDEIEAVPLVVRDTEGHGSFFTSIDLHQSPSILEQVRRHLQAPGVWAYAVNEHDLTAVYEWEKPIRAPEVALALARLYGQQFHDWEYPEAVLLNGNGIRLGRDRAVANGALFSFENAEVAAWLTRELDGHLFKAATPGTTAIMRRGALESLTDTVSWIEPLPENVGSALDGEFPVSGFRPTTGRTDLHRDQWTRLRVELEGFARFLFGRHTFRGLQTLALGRDYGAEVNPTFVFLLRSGADDRTVFEYRPRECRFVEVACPNPRKTYVAGMEAWATDLLAVLEMALTSAEVFHLGGKTLWNQAAARFRFDVDTEIFLYRSPLRNPARYVQLYRRNLASRALQRIRARPAPAITGVQPVIPVDRQVSRQRPPVAARFLPAEAQTADAAASEHSPAPPPPTALVQAPEWERIVAGVTAGRWRLESAGRMAVAPGRPASLVLMFSTPSGPVSLEAWLDRTERPHYRAVGALTFAYSAPTSGRDVRTIDALIDALGQGMDVVLRET
jgi:L-ascorbate metabolism protein UlaG (beta-lactamase superfamily)